MLTIAKLHGPLRGVQSRQERFVAMFASQSLGFPWVFAPEEWVKPSKKRVEPADVAWVSNGCLVLMYMCRAEPVGNPDRDARKAEKAIRHNVDQARRAIGYWRRYAPIVGQNRSQRFELAYRPDRHVVVLSVIDSPAARAEYHDDLRAELGVAHAITIPESMLRALAAIGGGMLDLVGLIEYVRDLGPFSERDCLDIVAALDDHAHRRGGGDKLWPTAADARASETWRRCMRMLTAEKVAADFGSLQLYTEDRTIITTDIWLADVVRCVSTIAPFVDEAEAALKTHGAELYAKTARIPVTDYDIWIVVVPRLDRVAGEAVRKSVDLQMTSLRDGGREGLFVLIDVAARTAMVTSASFKESATKRRLDDARTRRMERPTAP